VAGDWQEMNDTTAHYVVIYCPH